MQGDPRVIEYLNRAIPGELAAQNQYWLHSRMLDNWGIRKLAKHWLAEVDDERRHCNRFIERCIFLEGQPQMQTIDRLRIGSDIPSLLANDLAAEMGAVALYREAAAYCDSVDDFVTRDIFEATLADEEGHVNFLETQISLVGRLGVDLYVQHHIGKP